MINLCVRRRVPDLRNAESGRMEGTGRSHRGSHGAETVTTSPRRRCRRCKQSHHNATDQFEPFPDRCLNMQRNDNTTTTTRQQDYNNNDKYNNNIMDDMDGKNTLFIANYGYDDIGIQLCRSSLCVMCFLFLVLVAAPKVFSNGPLACSTFDDGLFVVCRRGGARRSSSTLVGASLILFRKGEAKLVSGIIHCLLDPPKRAHWPARQDRYLCHWWSWFGRCPSSWMDHVVSK
jgi:hypothetical protein